MRAIGPCFVLPLAVAMLGCREPPAQERYAPAAVPTNAATISVEDVSGTILGKPFELHTARYTVDRRPRYEKLEIQLLSSKLEAACDALGSSRETAVWLRRKGPGDLQAGSVRFGPDDNVRWEAHYEQFEDGSWTGNGTAAVVLELKEPALDLELTGEVYACFGDRTQSCVSGRFAAVYCPIRIDAPVRGTDSMERPAARSGRAVVPSTPLADAHERPPGAPPEPESGNRIE